MENSIYVPSWQKDITEKSITTRSSANIVQTSAIIQANATARQWNAGLMQGIWQGGNSWLTLEVGTGTNTTESVPSRLGNPVLRKLIDAIYFVDPADGVSQAYGPTNLLQMNASLQTPDANGLLISEYAIYGGGLNLNQAPFGTGLLILYQAITPIMKTSSFSISFQTKIVT